MSIRRVLGILSLLLVGAVGLRPARAQQPVATAQASVESWLALVDTQQYAESWQTAASFFRNAVTAQKWEAAVKAAREPLGALKSRVMKSVTSTRTLPGAPDGDYRVFQFDSSFEHKAAALETVTAIRESDGKWRVAGYFVR
jgi:Protein of unknown function (DUF4019)